MATNKIGDTILSEVRSVKAMVVNQGKILKKHAKKIEDLEELNKVALIKKQAVDDFVEQQQQNAKNRDEANYARTKLKLLRDLSPFIASGIGLLYYILSRHQ